MINASKKFITVIGKHTYLNHAFARLTPSSLSTNLFHTTSIKAKSATSHILPTVPEADPVIFSDKMHKTFLKQSPKFLESGIENFFLPSTSETQSISERNNSPIVSIEDAFSRFKKEEVGVGYLSFDDVLQYAVTNDFDDSGLGRLLKAQGHFQNGPDFYPDAEYELEKAVELDSRVEKLASEFTKIIDKYYEDRRIARRNNSDKN